MEANGRPGGSESVSEDNVVRLPREWLGPREELVPFAVDDEPLDQLASPPSTHDFWGEASDDGWVTPADQAAPVPRRRLPRRRGVSHARETTVGRFLRRSLNRTRPAAFSRRAPNRGAVAPRRLSPSAGVAVAVVLIVVGVAVSAAGHGNPAPAGHTPHGAQARATATVAAGIGFEPPHAAGRLRARPSAPRTHPAPHRTTSATRRVSQPARRRAVPHARHSRTSTIEPVRYTAPAATTTSPSPIAAPPVTTPVTAPATTAARPAAGSHQPATGASGALGPGSSPDG